jgi:polysaccharide chain length determinant protein (PEP-CTERM system associated)
MLGHRQLRPNEYWQILKRRGWIVLIPALLMPFVGLAISYLIPPQYVSQTTVLIDQQKVPDDYVKPVVTADLDNRLATMKEQILSRSRLQPIIERLNLYPGQSMESRIDNARTNISIKLIHSEIARSGGLPGFYIAFKAGDPRTAQVVCGEITSLFINANTLDREQSTQGTTDFLKGQLEEAKRNLDEQDARLAEFQKKYVGKLPGEESPNLNMLTSLNTQLEAATQQLARMQQDKTYAESMLAQQTHDVQPGDSPAYVQSPQQIEMAQLQAQETELSTRYTSDYPDLIAVRRKIGELRAKMAASPAGSTRAATTTPTVRESVGVQQLRAQIRAATQGIEAKRQEQAQIQNAVRLYQDRIQSTPLVAAEYKQITRDYQTAQQFYDDLLTKVNHSKMATDLEKRQQGEQFKLMDEPSLPEAPSSPKRPLFAGAGLALGLLLGFTIAALLEFRDQSLNTETDIWETLNLPTLATISWVGDKAPESAEPKGLKQLFQKSPKDAVVPSGAR